MWTPQITWSSLWRLVLCFIIVISVVGTDPAWATDISWRATTTQTANPGDNYTREGTAVFAGGEEAQVVINGTMGPGSFYASGTASGEQVIRFRDGSGFTLHFVSIWRGRIQRVVGIFGDGVGRFAGMNGSATGTSGAASTGPAVTDWVGTYEVPPK